ncbi:uncharacterized protein C1orf100 homolog [Chanos chanos]|uniref:Uncharacterized protein C1orf100 homolog n=1 Tax=Chanos chanos TaxID=29144 RepID=A0A6J2VY49_CHACN|nr:uncharacterized protein C1orf100 homolog [Chanos chanos]
MHNLGILRVPRHGRDVHGLYPGQLGRVHTDYSPLYRKGPSSPLDPLRLETSTEDHLYQRSFDLLTLEALEHSHRSGQTAARPQPRTTYQEDFGLQSHFYPPDDTKFTLLSHPGPLQPRTLCLPRGIFEE